MLAYFLLLFYVFAVMVITKVLIKSEKRQKIVCLILSMIGIYLILVLKAPSVGRDIEGYKRMYEAFKGASWSHYDLYWTETGFEFLEMFFTHTLGFDFQGFTACVYGIAIICYSVFFYKYSEDVTLSCFVYLCFGFFTFDISGIRNMLSMAIVILAVMFAEKKSIWLNLIFFALVILAAQIHRGAYFSILMFFFIRFPMRKNRKLLLPLFAVAAAAIRPFANSLLAFLDTKNRVEQIAVGGNIIAYIMILVFPFIMWNIAKHDHEKKYKYIGKNTPVLESESFFKGLYMPMRVFYFGIITVVMAGVGTSTLVRLAQPSLFFMTLVLPNTVQKLEPRSRLIVKTAVYAFLALYFYIFKLAANDLDMGPYIFYWNG
ncbi:MAG: EpsG family protein [Clostridia bacterium]|nr:EpsG family protein [Clostridia bacterium]